MALYAEGAGYKQQAYMHRRDIKKFNEAVEAYKAKGFTLINVEYGAGDWLGIFAKGARYKDVVFEFNRYRDDFEKAS